MTDALRQKFLERLFAVAGERYRRANAAMSASDPEGVRAEAHALAGEAFMLGETDLGDLASRAERAAIDWAAGNGDNEQVAGTLAKVATFLSRGADGI